MPKHEPELTLYVDATGLHGKKGNYYIVGREPGRNPTIKNYGSYKNGLTNCLKPNSRIKASPETKEAIETTIKTFDDMIAGGEALPLEHMEDYDAVSKAKNLKAEGAWQKNKKKREKEIKEADDPEAVRERHRKISKLNTTIHNDKSSEHVKKLAIAELKKLGEKPSY